MAHDVTRKQQRLDALSVSLRAHVEAAKCIVVAQRQRASGSSGLTVSTLKEAEQFFAAGFDDILYAVCVALPEPAAHGALPTLRQASVCLWFANRPCHRGVSPDIEQSRRTVRCLANPAGLQAASGLPQALLGGAADYSARAITSFMISLVPP